MQEEIPKDTYFTIQNPTEGLYKDKGSKFLAYAYSVANEEEIKERQEELRKKHYDARHHCYAWILGMDGENFRANDDGEPNHSAGDPILNQIRSFELSDVLVVVVRYFGGTKLGVSGLIQAYKEATREALQIAEKREVVLNTKLTFHFDYEAMNEIMRTVKDLGLEVIEQDFRQSCILHCLVRNSLIPQLEGRLSYVPGLKNWELEDTSAEENS